MPHFDAPPPRPRATVVVVLSGLLFGATACNDDGQSEDTSSPTGTAETTGTMGTAGTTDTGDGDGDTGDGDGDTGDGDGDTGDGDGDTGDTGDTTGEPPFEQWETYPTSLHATRVGKETFYTGTQEAPGVQELTGVAYDELACGGCHASTLADGTPVDALTYEPSCADCHVDPEEPNPDVPDMTCLGCHSRQGAEINLAMGGAAHMSDVHRDAGMVCVDCHSGAQMHGDGNAYASLLAPGAPRTDCSDCHPDPPKNMSHNSHIDELDCASCHTQSVITCNNCHFETELAGFPKRFFGPPPLSNFSLLVNREQTGRIHPATYQSLTYAGQSFMVIAPYYSHTVGPSARTCDDCHGAAALQQYTNTGSIDFVTWDADSQTITGPSGVIPVPPDWYVSLVVDFLDYTAADLGAPTDPGAWEFQQTGIDLGQMLYATPLSQDQIDALNNGG